MLEALNVPDEISSLGTANGRQNYAWGWWPVTKSSIPHLLPQVYISAIRLIPRLLMPDEINSAIDSVLVEVALLCPKPPYQNNHRLPGMSSM